MLRKSAAEFRGAVAFPGDPEASTDALRRYPEQACHLGLQIAYSRENALQY
jgi:hypothetical protein